MFRPGIVAFIAAFAAASGVATAQEWPTRTLTMVYPFAAGSAADVKGRLFASRMGELLGQSVVFESVGGGGGMTGSARVAKSAPDGYTFLLGSTFLTLFKSLFKKPTIDPVTELTPVALTAEQPVMMLARKDLPADTLQEFIAYARANRETILHGSGGLGAAPHLAIELLGSTIGVKPRHVLYRGGGPAMQDLITSRFDYFGTLPATAMPQLEAKTVKAIAIFSMQRLPALPQVPTAHEQGLKNFEVVAWYGFFLPKGTPEAIVRRLRAATIATIETAEVRKRLEQLAYTMAAPERQSSDYLQRLVESDTARWGAVVEKAGIEPQ